MDFNKLKQLLTGIPQSTEEQEKLKAQNMQAMKDEVSSMDAEKTGREMTPGEMQASSERKKLIEDAMNNATGFAGSMKVAGKVPAALADTAAGKLVQDLIDKVHSGERLSAAQELLIKKAQGGGTAVVDALGTKPPVARKITSGPSVAEMKEALQPAQQSLQLQIPEKVPLQVEKELAPVSELARFAAVRKLTGGY